MSDDVTLPQSASPITIAQVEHGFRMYAAAFTAAAQALGKGLKAAAAKTKEFASAIKDHVPKFHSRAQVDPESLARQSVSQRHAEERAKVKEQSSLPAFDKETETAIANAGQQLIVSQSQASGVTSDSAQEREQRENAKERDQRFRTPDLNELAAMGLKHENEKFRSVGGESWQLPSVAVGAQQRGR